VPPPIEYSVISSVKGLAVEHDRLTWRVVADRCSRYRAVIEVVHPVTGGELRDVATMR
jgi:hypothetical protein